MRKLVFLLCFLTLVDCGHAQKTPNHDWNAVRNLTTEERIRVDTWAHGDECIFISATETNLICERRQTYLYFIHAAQRYAFRRTEIRRIRIAHKIKSTILGGVVGFAVGAGIGAAVDGHSSGGGLLGNHAGLLFIGGLVTALGIEIFGFLDVLAGPEIYRAP